MGNTINKISIGEEHALAILDGNLYARGNNNFFACGISGATFIQKFRLVSNSGNWEDIAAGRYHSLGICGGALYSWGWGEQGQLGLTFAGTRADGLNNPNDFSNYIIPNFAKNIPTKVGGLTGWTKVSAGADHSLGINSGYLYGWGRNKNFQVGIGAGYYNFCGLSTVMEHLLQPITVPMRIANNNTWSHISAFSNSSAGISGGRLYSWGFNDNNLGKIRNWPSGGGCGVGDGDKNALVTLTNNFVSSSTSMPTKLEFFSGWFLSPGTTFADWTNSTVSSTNWTDVSISNNHGLGISGGHLYAWGDNSTGQLGNNSTISVSTPTLIDNTKIWKRVKCNNFVSSATEFVADEFEFLYNWGINLYGNLGVGDANTKKIPTAVNTLSHVLDFSISGNISGFIQTDTDGTDKIYLAGNLSSGESSQLIGITIDPNIRIPNQYKISNSLIKNFRVDTDGIWIIKNQLQNNTNLDFIRFLGMPAGLPLSSLQSVNRDPDTGLPVRYIDFYPLQLGSIGLTDTNKFVYNGVFPVTQGMSPRAWKKINDRDPILKIYGYGDMVGIQFDDGYIETFSQYKSNLTYQPIYLDWKQIESGGKHIVILTNDNRILCFGDNSVGQCNVPPGLSDISSIFAMPEASGAVKNNGEVVYWGNVVDLDTLTHLEKADYGALNPTQTIMLPKNRSYKHNLIGYTFDGQWGETAYKNSVKQQLQNYYNQLGKYPNKLILNIEEGHNNQLRWFNEPAKIKYLGYTLNSSGITTPNDGVTYQNVYLSNNFIAPTSSEDFSSSASIIYNFYNLGYTLAKQAIFELTGNRNSVAIGYNAGQLLPDYTWLGFSADSQGYSLTSRINWATGNTLINYKEFNSDNDWYPYIKQGPDSYLPVNGFDVSVKTYKNYSGSTASTNFYLNSIGITGAVFNAYYDRWKQFLNNINYDFILDPNLNKFVYPEQKINTQTNWSRSKQLLKNYETEYNTKLNKNILTNYSYTKNELAGTTLNMLEHGPVLNKGNTGIFLDISLFSASKLDSKLVYDYNSIINNLRVFDNIVSAISGNTLEQGAFNQWYYYGVLGKTFSWDSATNDPGYTAIHWGGLINELSTQDYTVFDDNSKENVKKLVNTINYLTNINTIPDENFNFYNIKNIIKIKSGKDHSVLLDKLGTVYFLGSTLDNKQNIPAGTYIDISAGDAHSAAINNTGKLFTAGKIITDSGGCSGSTLSTNLLSIEGTFDMVESGGNHLVLFETGENKKYLGRVDKVDEVFKRIYVKSYSAPDQSEIRFVEPSGTNVSIIRDGNIIKNIQHKLLSIDSYMDSVQYIIDSSGNIQDPGANNGTIWKNTFIGSYQTASGNDLLITPYKQQQAQIQVTEIKYLNNNKLYEFEKQFKNLVQTENKIDIRITDL